MTKKQRANFKKVAALKDYWVRYETQTQYLNYSNRTFMDDALYGIGIAIDHKKYGGADGYERFKKQLIAFLLDA